MIEQIRYCSKTKLLKTTQEKCITNLISNIPAHCNITAETIEDTVEMIEPGHLFILTHTEIVMETTCRENSGNKTLKGTSLIYFENCTIKLNNIQYSSKYPTFWDSVEIVSTVYNEINSTVMSTNLTLQKLNKWTTKNTDAITLLNLRNNTNNIYIIGAIFITIPITIAIIILMQLVKQMKKVTRPEPDQPTGTPTQPIQLSWPSLHY